MSLFSILTSKKQDAFAQRAKQQKVWQSIRRIVDATTPNIVEDETSHRSWERYNRCLPVACVPVQDESIDTSTIVYGCTIDFSENGFSLATSSAIEPGPVICGFWYDDLKLIRGEVKRITPFGGDLSKIGIELTEVIECGEMLLVLQNPLQKLNPQFASAAGQ